MIHYILWMTRQYRVKENEGSRTPPLYSLPCEDQRLFVSCQPLCVAIDGVVLAATRCRPCLLLVFTPCTPLSTCLLPLVLVGLLVLHLTVVPDLYIGCACSSSRVCDACCVCVVLVPACNPVSCCTCFCRRHVPALTSALCLTFVGVLIPVCSPSRALFLFAGQAEHTPVCLGGCMTTPCFPVSGDAGDLDCQTIPIGLWGAVSRKMLRNCSGGFLRGMGAPRVLVTFVRRSVVSWEREDLM